MNGFEQIKSFYSWVFNNPDKVRPTHISLYLFLLNQNNRAMWVEWFKCPYDLAMQGACIGNKNTYYKCLDDLQSYKLIEYKKGINNYKAPMIRLIQLYDIEPLTVQVTVPQSEKLTVPQPEPLTVLLNKNIYKLITENHKTVNDKLETWLNLSDLKKKIFNFKNSLIEYGFEEKLVDEWMAVRKNKKATNTETSFKKFISQIELAPEDKNEILKLVIEKDWRGFEYQWLVNLQNEFKKTIQPQQKMYGRLTEETMIKNGDMTGIINPYAIKNE